MTAGAVIGFTEAAERIPTPEGARAVRAFARGSLDVALSMPSGPNAQTPHAQDELYVVLRGAGTLVWGAGERAPFAAGDLLFVAAGTEHHYEAADEGLALWRIFYGPDGGEREGETR